MGQKRVPSSDEHNRDLLVSMMAVLIEEAAAETDLLHYKVFSVIVDEHASEDLRRYKDTLDELRIRNLNKNEVSRARNLYSFRFRDVCNDYPTCIATFGRPALLLNWKEEYGQSWTTQYQTLIKLCVLRGRDISHATPKISLQSVRNLSALSHASYHTMPSMEDHLSHVPRVLLPRGHRPWIYVRTFTGHLLAKLLKELFKYSGNHRLRECRFLQDQFPQGCTQEVVSIEVGRSRHHPQSKLPKARGLLRNGAFLVIMSISGPCIWNRILALPDGDHEVPPKSLVKDVLDSMVDMVSVHTTDLFQDHTTTHFRIAPENREQCAQKVLSPPLKRMNTFQCSEEEMLQLGLLPSLKEEYTAGLPKVPDVDWELSSMGISELMNLLVPVDPTKQYRQDQWREASVYCGLYARLGHRKLANEMEKLVKASASHGKTEAIPEAYHSTSDVD